MLRTPPASARAAEHQLLAIADWLLDAQDPATEPVGLDLSPEVATAMDRLGDDQTAQLDLHALAAEVGLSYDTFRRRFTAPGRPVAVGVPHLAAGSRPPPPCSGSPT